MKPLTFPSMLMHVTSIVSLNPCLLDQIEIDMFFSHFTVPSTKSYFFKKNCLSMLCLLQGVYCATHGKEWIRDYCGGLSHLICEEKGPEKGMRGISFYPR